MGYTFNGVTKIIQLTNGTTEFSVADMYSRWIDWLLTGDNSKYPFAFRFDGGSPVTATKNQGIIFFLTNDWRIRPQESNHKLTVDGVVVTDPSGYNPFVETIGSYNVLIDKETSNIVDTIQMSTVTNAITSNNTTIESIVQSKVQANNTAVKEAILDIDVSQITAQNTLGYHLAKNVLTKRQLMMLLD